MQTPPKNVPRMFQHSRQCQYCIAPGLVGFGAVKYSVQLPQSHGRCHVSEHRKYMECCIGTPRQKSHCFRLFLMYLKVYRGPRCKKTPFFFNCAVMKSCYRWRNPSLCFGHTFPTVVVARNRFKRCHFHSGRRVSTEFPAANSFWQPGVGSEQPPVILFLHMASSVKRSLRIPARARRSTCDWPVCCRRSCQPTTRC